MDTNNTSVPPAPNLDTVQSPAPVASTPVVAASQIPPTASVESSSEVPTPLSPASSTPSTQMSAPEVVVQQPSVDIPQAPLSSEPAVVPPVPVTPEPVASAPAAPESVPSVQVASVEPVVSSEPKLENGVVPPMPPKPSGSSNNMLVLGIVAAVAILLGGVAAYNAVLQSKTHTAAMHYQANNVATSQAHPSVTPAAMSDQITAKDASDTQLNQDQQTITKQVDQFTTDLHTADQGLNDQPDTLNQ